MDGHHESYFLVMGKNETEGHFLTSQAVIQDYESGIQVIIYSTNYSIYSIHFFNSRKFLGKIPNQTIVIPRARQNLHKKYCTISK
jgi:hypothetical protein